MRLLIEGGTPFDAIHKYAPIWWRLACFKINLGPFTLKTNRNECEKQTVWPVSFIYFLCFQRTVMVSISLDAIRLRELEIQPLHKLGLHFHLLERSYHGSFGSPKYQVELKRIEKGNAKISNYLAFKISLRLLDFRNKKFLTPTRFPSPIVHAFHQLQQLHH